MPHFLNWGTDMATANRGKWAEGQVKAWMTKRSDAEAGFWFYRYPDPHAGSLQSVPADFGALHDGDAFLVEVKEVQHAFRLPAKNFSADKVARMVKFTLAGGEGWVAVCHQPDKVWRLVPISVFSGERPASWDLRAHPLFESASAALRDLFGEIK